MAIAKRILSSQSKCKYKIFAIENNAGKCNAYNKAYQNSTGSIITLIGADDIAPTFRTLTAFKAMISSKSSYVYGSYKTFEFSNDYQISQTLKLLRINPCFYNAVPGGTSFLSRTLADLIFPIPISLPAEDWYISYQAYMNNVTPYFVNDCLLYYRVHDSNSTSIKSRPAYLKAIKREIVVLSYLLSVPCSKPLNLLRRSIHFRSLIISFLENPSPISFVRAIICFFSPLRARFLKSVFLVSSSRL